MALALRQSYSMIYSTNQIVMRLCVPVLDCCRFIAGMEDFHCRAVAVTVAGRAKSHIRVENLQELARMLNVWRVETVKMRGQHHGKDVTFLFDIVDGTVRIKSYSGAAVTELINILELTSY